jgi:N6-adenosine-specific RNA methylase IME4
MVSSNNPITEHVPAAIVGADFEHLERIVERGITTFVEVGQALGEIRDRRLYRDSGFRSFEIYVRRRWSLEVRHANQTIAASAVQSRLSTMAPQSDLILPKNERQIRPLTQLPDEQWRPCWQEVVETAKRDGDGVPIVTAKHVEKVAKRYRHGVTGATPAPLTGTYRYLLADPPWRYESATAPPTRRIENHYPTMTHAEICDLTVPAHSDCVLFMWATSPKLAESIAVLDAWEFNYRTCMVWVKDRIGMGYYARQRHELLLIAVKGTPGVPSESNRPDSVIEAPRTKHSRKPAESYEVIERMYPDILEHADHPIACELFQRRNPRDCWDGWGLEASENGIDK